MILMIKYLRKTHFFLNKALYFTNLIHRVKHRYTDTGKILQKKINSTSREENLVLPTNQHMGFRKLYKKCIQLENIIVYNLLKTL